MKCHYIYTKDGEKVLIPYCWPVVLTGDMSQCTCRPEKTFAAFERERYNVLPISDEYDNDDNPRLIRAEWCPDDQPALSWRISSNMPYTTFTIKENGEPYCEGIIIDIDDIISNNK